MGPIDETKEHYTLDCYFRQYWHDDRLVYNGTSLMSQLVMNWQFLDKIWRPDTFFLNGKDSYLHKIAVPNRFIRISPDGKVSFSQRLTISAKCRMHLKKFPLDSQVCPLEIGTELVMGFSKSRICPIQESFVRRVGYYFDKRKLQVRVWLI